MFKEAIQQIQRTAIEAADAKIVRIPGDERRVLVQHIDKLQEYDVPPPLRKHVVHSLDDLIEYAKQVATLVDADGGPHPVVWHGTRQVVLVVDDGDRRDTVTFPLTHSGRLNRLSQLEREKTSFDQKRFVRLLRIELGMANDPIVAKFRKLDWKVADDSTGNVQHGKDRMGKAIQAEVQGVDELPEEISVSVPVYQEAGERQEYVVRCAVEIDPINQLFFLIPLPEEIQKAIDNAQADIERRLLDGLLVEGMVESPATIPVYYGTP